MLILLEEEDQEEEKEELEVMKAQEKEETDGNILSYSIKANDQRILLKEEV